MPTRPRLLPPDPTLIGRVRHVLGARVTVELDPALAGTSPLLRGRMFRVGQIGSVVQIPQGPIVLLGTVTMVGISEIAGPPPPGVMPSQGDRWLQVQLLGEIDGLGTFRRGVSTYPSLDDPVHLTTEDDLECVFPAPVGRQVRIGGLSTSEHVLTVDADRLVVRHSAIVGSTGAGKSSTVARIIQSIVDSGCLNANIVVVDPHGEYSDAFGSRATVRSVLEDAPNNRLWVPYWMLSPEELLQVYGGGRGTESPIIKQRFSTEVVAARERFVEEAGWTHPRREDITSEMPVPFDIRQVWWQMDYIDRATYSTGRGQGDVCLVNNGDAENLVGAKFEPYSQGGRAPHQGPPGEYGVMAPFTERLKSRLLDPLYGFLERERVSTSGADPLPAIFDNWMGGDRPVSILDFSGVPSEASDIAIGAVLNHTLRATLASPPDGGIGRHRPVLVVLEEAHRYLGETGKTSMARVAAERIAREGRKYGIGLMLVSQRPSEVSETVLSQCGTIIAHRLTNPADQSRVESALPDAVADLAQVLPSLRTGEVIVTGEAFTLPTRGIIDRPSPAPHAADPQLDSWSGEPVANDFESVARRLRGDR
jgi:uncharacterized protein